MFNGVEMLLVNLLFILIMMFIYHFYIDLRLRHARQQKITLFIICFCSILLSMSFPTWINEQFFVDLRQIPLIVGSLYGGPLVGIPLLFGTILYRVTIGGAGIYTAIITASGTVLFSLFFYRYVPSWGYKVRIGFMMLFSLFTSIYVLLVMELGFGLRNPASIWLTFCMIQVIGTGIVVATFENIIKQSHIRRQMTLSEKNQLVSHLAASISHEVRNPLTVSRGFMQLLMGNVSDEKKKEYIEIAISELNRAERIISDYLTFAKPFSENIQTLNIAEECKKVLEIARPLANMNSIRIKTDLSPCFVDGVGVSFQQCLVNIIKNGIEAMDQGGILYLSTLSTQSEVTIIIRDTGIGMTKEQLARLGEPYFSTKGSHGTGLGMMVVHQIIREMSGTLHVTSEKNVGTQFTIKLPVAVGILNEISHSIHTSGLQQSKA